MKDKKEQGLQLITEGYEPKAELPEDYELPSYLQKAWFGQDEKETKMKEDAEKNLTPNKSGSII